MLSPVAAAGFAVGGALFVLVVVGIIVYCIIAKRKRGDKNVTPMRQTTEPLVIYASPASYQMNYNSAHVSKYPNPVKEKEDKRRMRGYDNPSFKPNTSGSASIDDTDYNSSDAMNEGRDISPPRRTKTAYDNFGYSSDSSFDDSSSFDKGERKVSGNVVLKNDEKAMDKGRSSGIGVDHGNRASFAKGQNAVNTQVMPVRGQYKSRRDSPYSRRIARLDTRCESLLKVESLEKHVNDMGPASACALSTNRKETETTFIAQTSPATDTLGELDTTLSRPPRYQKNAHFRRSSSSRSSSQHRIRKNKDKVEGLQERSNGSHISRSRSRAITKTRSMSPESRSTFVLQVPW